MKKVIIILYFILMGVISICANEMGNHQEGYWIVLQNRIQDEVWYELNDDYDTGDFTTVLRLSYSEYGHVPDDDNIYYEDNHLPDVPFYFVINGVNYGPLTNNQVTIYGYALANPLAENNNHYIIPSGWCYNVGIATDDAGNMYCYVAVANPAGGSQYDYMFNCYDDGLYYRIEENNNEAVLTYNQDNPYQGGHVIIPESVAWRGSTYPVTAIDGTRWRAWGAFSGCTGLTDITIPNSVTTIGDGAFSGCTGLTDITIPNSVTTIGDGAFSGCTGLTDITIPNSVTFIGWYAFYGCTGLTEIMIPKSVTSIGGYAFSGCTGLTDITIPNSVTSIGGYAFYHCI